MARARDGDRPAAEELVGLHYEAIFAFFRRWCRSEADAADLTQRTFAKAWAALPEFQARSRFSTWLHGIAHHLLVDGWRRKNPLESASDDWWETCPAQGPSPFEETAHRDLARQVWALVGQLEFEQRETVHLHYFQGLSLEETAQALEVAASTVKYRLRQAVEFLRARLQEPNGQTRLPAGAVLAPPAARGG